ncbi:nucleotide exchange factor GrpE [Myxococcota bacterium]|nr:nucleotide exchange factor GrpE [Myxococcota bacterium]
MTPKPPDQSNGSGAEDAEQSLPPNPELEEALREAAEAVEAQAEGAAAAGEAEPAVLAEDEPEAEDPVAQLSAYADQHLRLQAEFENFRRRALKERQEAAQYGHQNLVKDLLSAVDNLERAIDHARRSEGGDLEGLLQGVELVQREMLTALGNHGVVQIESQGKVFDPAVHEAMAQAPDATVPPNTVIDVFEQGYMLRDRLIRPARVVVAKQPEGEETDQGGGESAD